MSPRAFACSRIANSADLLREARARAFAASETAVDLAAAIALIAGLAGAQGFESLLQETLGKREEIEALGGAEVYGAKLAAKLGLGPDETQATIHNEILEGGGGSKLRLIWAKQLSEGLKTDKERAGQLAEAAAASEPETAVGICLDAFFTQAGLPRKVLLTKGVSDRYPDFGDELYEEQARLEKLRDRLRSATAVARSRALVRVAEEVLKHYSDAKNAHGWLDFDDLIQRTLALLQNADAAWVLYKLDKGIDHILVDEAQDTSRAQWDILRKLAEDFLSGESSSSRRRTFFAVGDEKQSIFSFQGAAPAMFDAMRREFARRHREANRPFEPVNLRLSFRSARRILQAVDRVFAVESVWQGVSAGEPTAPPHDAFHVDLPGLVEVWAPIAPEPAPEPQDWRMPLDAAALRDPSVALADRIARVIKQWLSPQSSERVIDNASGLPRRICAGDILILVRSRGPFFEAMTRALRRAEIASAGADRLILNQHIAVMDMIAAGRAALSADDDLSLAAVLKSPLIGLDDDALLTFAPAREGSLTQALANSDYREAEARLSVWRERARKLSPFDFYARLVGVDGGRRALIGRLGPEAADAIDEFMALALAFDHADAPSLTAFLDEVEASAVAIKRDMEAEGSSVRVMTVHAAKGLEAPIVFLPDTSGAPGGRHDPKWLELDSAAPGMFVWAPTKALDSAPIAAARREAQAAAAGEHRRLLYVAMTRAAERLIIACFEGSQGRAQDCWYNLMRLGLDPILEEAPAPWDPSQIIWRYGQGAIPVDSLPPAEAIASAQTPDWLWRAPPPEAAPASLIPSHAAPTTKAPPSAERRKRMEAGRFAHALLQDLPGVSPELRPAAAEQFLARNAGALSPAQREAIAERVLAALALPELAALFGPGSLAEVAIAGALPRPSLPDLAFSGRIDRTRGPRGLDHRRGFQDRRKYREHNQGRLYRAARALSGRPRAALS